MNGKKAKMLRKQAKYVAATESDYDVTPVANKYPTGKFNPDGTPEFKTLVTMVKSLKEDSPRKVYQNMKKEYKQQLTQGGV